MALADVVDYRRRVTADETIELGVLLREHIAFHLHAGILAEDALTAQIEAIVQEELGAPDPAWCARMAPLVTEAMHLQLAQETQWTARTQNDELDAALVELAERGIIGLQANGTTIQHGWAIAEAVAAQVAPDARGAVFYHLQDLDRGVAGEGLALAFGAFDRTELAEHASRTPPPEGEGETFRIQRRSQNAEGHGRKVSEETRVIGEEIVAVLRRHGFGPTWDGSAQTRIQLAPFAWQKRRQTQAPARTQALPALVLPAEPIPEPVCPDCEGRGWLPPLVPGDFSEFCWCKGGKRPRTAVPAPAAEAPAQASPSPAWPVVEAPPPPASPGEEAPPSPAPDAPLAATAEAEPPSPVAPLGVLARLKKWLGGDS